MIDIAMAILLTALAACVFFFVRAIVGLMLNTKLYHMALKDHGFGLFWMEYIDPGRFTFNPRMYGVWTAKQVYKMYEERHNV